MSGTNEEKRILALAEKVMGFDYGRTRPDDFGAEFLSAPPPSLDPEPEPMDPATAGPAESWHDARAAYAPEFSFEIHPHFADSPWEIQTGYPSPGFAAEAGSRAGRPGRRGRPAFSQEYSPHGPGHYRYAAYEPIPVPEGARHITVKTPETSLVGSFLFGLLTALAGGFVMNRYVQKPYLDKKFRELGAR